MVGRSRRAHGIANVTEIADAFAAMKRSGARTLIVQPAPFTFQQRELLIDLAVKHGFATIFAFPIAAREGALIGYGPDFIQMYRRAPFYVARILKGAKPAELPVELPTKVELVINLKTAKALGLEVPLSLLIRADELVD